MLCLLLHITRHTVHKEGVNTLVRVCTEIRVSLKMNEDEASLRTTFPLHNLFVFKTITNCCQWDTSSITSSWDVVMTETFRLLHFFPKMDFGLSSMGCFHASLVKCNKQPLFMVQMMNYLFSRTQGQCLLNKEKY